MVLCENLVLEQAKAKDICALIDTYGLNDT